MIKLNSKKKRNKFIDDLDLSKDKVVCTEKKDQNWRIDSHSLDMLLREEN